MCWGWWPRWAGPSSRGSSRAIFGNREDAFKNIFVGRSLFIPFLYISVVNCNLSYPLPLIDLLYCLFLCLCPYLEMTRRLTVSLCIFLSVSLSPSLLLSLSLYLSMFLPRRLQGISKTNQLEPDKRDDRLYRRPPTYLILASKIVRPSTIYKVRCMLSKENTQLTITINVKKTVNQILIFRPNGSNELNIHGQFARIKVTRTLDFQNQNCLRSLIWT